jgi:preprotein translocase subunit YajC
MISSSLGCVAGSLVVATLAQDGGTTPPPPGGSIGPGPAAPAAPAPQGPVVPGMNAPAGTTQAPGTPGAPTQQPRGGSGLDFFLPILLIMVFFLIVTSMAGRKEKKRRAALLSGVKRGDRVQTVGGEIGTIVDLSESEMTLRVDETSNTRIRFARSALQSILKESKEEAKA